MVAQTWDWLFRAFGQLYCRSLGSIPFHMLHPACIAFFTVADICFLFPPTLTQEVIEAQLSPVSAWWRVPKRVWLFGWLWNAVFLVCKGWHLNPTASQPVVSSSSGQLSLFKTIETGWNRMESLVNRRLGFLSRPFVMSQHIQGVQNVTTPFWSSVSLSWVKYHCLVIYSETTELQSSY